MLTRLLKASVLTSFAFFSLNATQFDAQAQKDKEELVKYFEAFWYRKLFLCQRCKRTV
jgi:sulfur-oxidizing protein SoxA